MDVNEDDNASGEPRSMTFFLPWLTTPNNYPSHGEEHEGLEDEFEDCGEEERCEDELEDEFEDCDGEERCE